MYISFSEKRVCPVVLSHISQNKLIGLPDADDALLHEENCFVLKAVIARSEVSPSWMHPTKLYSCFIGDKFDETESQPTVKQMKQDCMFSQMLTLVSSKSLNIVSLKCVILFCPPPLAFLQIHVLPAIGPACWSPLTVVFLHMQGGGGFSSLLLYFLVFTLLIKSPSHFSEFEG